MPVRRRARSWIVGVLGVSVVAAVAVGVIQRYRRDAVPRGAAVAFDEKTPWPALESGLRQSDGRALAVLYHRLETPTAPKALTDVEAGETIATLGALRTGFLKFSAFGRALTLEVATRLLNRFAIEPAPARWTQALTPVRDLLISGLADPDLEVRVAALGLVGQLWKWSPGCSVMQVEAEALAAWKQGLHAPVVRRLTDRQVKVRAAAVSCLGLLPIDNAAAPAIAHLEDPAAAVRQQVIISFAARRDLLTEDALLKHLYDEEPRIGKTVELVLEARGLNPEQIALGQQIFNPKPELRAAVIPLLKGRTDIDPEVWLLHLSRDRDESVRISAAEALAERFTPEARRRLAEMAESDPSPNVRRVASQLITAALPPLPGSPSLNPRAN